MTRRLSIEADQAIIPEGVVMELECDAYREVTRDIKVSVWPEHDMANSNPAAGLFAFSYTVTITNLGPEIVQLIERHWVVRTSGETVAEVVGPGVAGVEPVLESGEKFRYTSGALIENPLGEMYGSFTFRSESGKFFQVTIPRFDLFYPLIIH